MDQAEIKSRQSNGTKTTKLDAVVVGAGIAGLYQLYRMRQLGLKVRAYEAGSGVGGTWYWNRYPGARFDSQVEVYQYWFSEDLYKAWKPSERFPAQPETEQWLNFVADRFDLKKDIQFSTRIESATYREKDGRWDVVTSDGERIDTQYLLACCGMLSAPLNDRFPGQSTFKGVSTTFAGFDYDFENRPWAELTPDERTQVLEKYWNDGSLSMWLATFPEMFFDEAVSAVVSDFVRDKMRKRLRHDPKLCDLLIPSEADYGFGTHRVPLETKYLEVYLQDNVEGVNCRKTPIERIVPEGIQTSDGKVHEADIIVLAVGFDAGSGALSRIDIRGRDGHSLKDRWHDDIRTAMGLQVHGYPNLFTTGAPLAPSAALCNMTTCLQQQVDWITDCIVYARENGKGVVEATKEFEDNWVKHHDETAAATLVVKTDSWYMGSNVGGKPRRLLAYIGGVGNYNQQCDALAANGYQGFEMT